MNLKSLPNEYVTLVEVLERTRSFEEFSTIAQATVRRLEEGVRALVSIQFYANPNSTEASAILTFADRTAMMQHINMMTTDVPSQSLLNTEPTSLKTD